MSEVPRTSAKIRQSFIDFFANKEHTFVPSAPVAPHDDPTLMFTNAGMNQFKGIFLGDNPKNLSRATNSQKCIRVSGKHNDLDEVGRDTYHHTMFEMLGNWSFGDYYKEEAIAWAWELLTQVWQLPKERLFVSVYEDDDEAAEIWKKVSALPDDRIMRFGAKDNFWEMGETGPCGPCSEIHFDRGDLETQAATFQDEIEGVNGENDRYIEIWNLVFIQYNRMTGGELKPLEKTHVDTGMGFERVCAVLQDVRSNYDTDVFKPLIDEIAKLSEVPYSGNLEGMPHRVVADHLRTVSFAIADGVLPSNEGRGYVIRRILRRASRYARQLNQTEAFICKLVPKLVEQMGDFFPEIKERADFVAQVIRSEEEAFIKTLDRGLELWSKMVQETKDSGNSQVDGEKVFTLYDTYGFPVDLTRILAEEEELTIDEAGYEKHMQAQKDRARAARKDAAGINFEEGWVTLDDTSGTEFLGYEKNESVFKIARYKDEGEGSFLITSTATPFYAESGGQIGDQGLLTTENLILKVVDTVKINDVWLHKAKVVEGQANAEVMQQEFQAVTDSKVRQAIRRNHTATHLLHFALREKLGSHVAQQGSRVAPEDLRFDFSHFQGLTSAEVAEIEDRVNELILENAEVNTKVMDVEAAKASGAMALFGEKYDSDVRVVSMGPSVELCGGLHAARTGDLGSFKIVSESSTATGVRRIMALTGMAAIQASRKEAQVVADLQAGLKCKPAKIVDRVVSLQESMRDLEKQQQVLQDKLAAQMMQGLTGSAEEVAGVKVLIKSLKDEDKKSFASIVDQLASGFDGIAVISNVSGNNGSLAVTVTKSLVQKAKAGELVGKIAALADGRGGGRPDRAQAGLKSIEKVPAAMEAAKKIVAESLA